MKLNASMIARSYAPAFSALFTAAVFAGDPAIYTPGQLEAEFGGDGTVIVPLQDFNVGRTVRVDDIGSVFVAGHSEFDGISTTREGNILRFNPDGSSDAPQRFPADGFGCAGLREFYTAEILSNGEIIAGGWTQTGCSFIPNAFDVLRISPEGAILDRYDFASFNNEDARVFALAVQADERVVAAGFASTNRSTGSTFDIAVARYNVDGTLDNTFASLGEFTLDIAGDRDEVKDMLILPDGDILLAGRGTTTAGGRDFALVRLDSSGALVPAFGVNGVVTIDFAGETDDLEAIAVYPSQGIVAVGTSTAADGVTRRLTVARFDFMGALDTQFADSGIALIDFGTSISIGTDIVVSSTGRIYVTGISEDGGDEATRDVVVACLLPDGTLDSAFGVNGRQTFSFGGGPIDAALSVHTDPNGRYVAVAGYAGERIGQALVTDFAVARLTGQPSLIFRDGFEAP